MTAPATPRVRVWSDRVTLSALGLWGAIHVLGGASLLAASTVDSLDTLAPDAATPAPFAPGDGAEALVRFHGLNVVLGGVAVLALAVWWGRHRSRWHRDVALGIAAALDIGLIAFLVAPGLLPATQGLVGPTLVVVAGGAAVSARRATRPT